MNPTEPLVEKCQFKRCNAMLPKGEQYCEKCMFELHVEIRRLQGYSREQATEEWRRDEGASQN